MQKILLAFDCFKGSISNIEVGEIFKSILGDSFSCTNFPLSDGGEGFIDGLKFNNAAKVKGHDIFVETHDGFMNDLVTSYYALNDDLCIIESSKILGFSKKVKNVPHVGLKTTSYGLGEVILDAYNKGFKDIYITLGGTSTMDMGIGVLSALGMEFYDDNNKFIIPIGDNVNRISIIERSNFNRLGKANIYLLCDVKNKLLGSEGCVRVFGPNKGLNGKDIKKLEEGFEKLARKVNNLFEIDICSYISSGSAGGIPSTLFAFLNARRNSGVDKYCVFSKLKAASDDANILVGGEGKIDESSLNGKCLTKLLDLKEKLNIPLILVCGSCDPFIKSKLEKDGITIFELVDSKHSESDCIKNAKARILETALKVKQSLLKVNK